MATNARLGLGSSLRVGDGLSPEGFLTVGEVQNLELGEENPLVDVTHLQSTAAEYIAGIPDPLEFEVPVNYDPANSTHSILLTANRTKTLKNFRAVINSNPAKTFSFSALVRAWHLTVAPDSQIVMVYTLKISGSILGPN